jgi:UDP-glucose 4-epimerase
MRILVTGGAGYIGGHLVDLLGRRGDEVVIVDDLVSGRSSRVPGVRLERMDLSADGAASMLTSLMLDSGIEAVVHLAARKQVAESVARPAWYFRQNLGALTSLLLAMEEAGVAQLVYSSSAAVYGATEGEAIRESDPALPINPYGETKRAGELLISSATRAFELHAVSLRYFNVAGSGSPVLGDDAALNLVPMVFGRLDEGLAPRIFGDDYPTPDGTCIRDYIHVLDLAEAHIAALDHLGSSGRGHAIYNVGTGVGTSVREVIDAILRVSGSSLEPVVEPRRPGDPACVVASPELIAAELGWRARLGIDEIVTSAWSAHSGRVTPA